jgi:Probable cobalt transporter subunit (CbtB)
VIESQTLSVAIHSSGTLDPQGVIMSDITIGTTTAPIPVREILPWLIFGALMLLAIYFVGAEEGATSIFKGMYVHEWVHDSRHLLGFPCH